jgi:hypothetical protein
LTALYNSPALETLSGSRAPDEHDEAADDVRDRI